MNRRHADVPSEDIRFDSGFASLLLRRGTVPAQPSNEPDLTASAAIPALRDGRSGGKKTSALDLLKFCDISDIITNQPE
ncbi:MAG: hypothetical protein R6V02_05495 [Candidatus Aminicenantes bacterium]